MRTKWEKIYWEPYIQIRHSSLLFYSLPTKQLPRNHHTLDYKTYSGKTTQGSVKRIKKAVDMLLQLSPPRWIHNTVSGRMEYHTLSFITLTIPGHEKHLEASEGHKLLLAPWLLRMKRKVNMDTYIWKAEFQKNGQLHYHITTPSWIPYYTIRDEWNNIMSKAKMLENWFQVNPNKMPNSTDVHKVYKVENIQGYLSKYLAKNDQDKETKGKIWDCSMNLKKAKFFSFPEPSDIDKFIDLKSLKNTDHCSFLFLKNPASVLPVNIQQEYKNFISKIAETV